MRDSRLSRTVWPDFLYPSKKRKTLIFFLRSLWVELIWLLPGWLTRTKDEQLNLSGSRFKVEARVREITRWEFSAQHRRWFSVWICILLLSQMKSTTFPVIVENLQENPLFLCWTWWRILITGNILNGNKQQRTQVSKKERKNRRNIQRKKKGTMGGMKEERKGGWKVWEIWEKRVREK